MPKAMNREVFRDTWKGFQAPLGPRTAQKVMMDQFLQQQSAPQEGAGQKSPRSEV